MLHKKIAQKRLAIILGGIIGSAGIGLLMTFAVFDTTQEIPDTDTGTIGYALSKIIAGNWQTDSGVQRSKQLGGVDGYKYLRLTGTGGCSNLNQALRSISPDGTSVQCETIVTTRDRPILATIRDLDSSCVGAVSITNTGTFINASGISQDQRTPQTYTANTSDPIDLYEDDTIETTAGCSLASLYMPDNSIIRLSANTKITLRYAGIPGGSGATSTDLDGGEMWARVLKPITDDSYFNINTQEASVGVRGTSVWISRDSTNKKTTALPIDSGRVSGTAGAIVVYPKHGELTALGTPVPLTHTITVDLDGKSQFAPYSTSTTTQIYKDKPFVRIATLADIKDFKALEKNVGNLATIQATKSDLTSGGIREDIYESSFVVNFGDNTANLIATNSTVSNEISETYPKSDPSNSDNDERSALCLGSTSQQQWWNTVPLGRENCIESNISFLADYSKNDSSLYAPNLGQIQNRSNQIADNGGIKIEKSNEYIEYFFGSINSLIGSEIKITMNKLSPVNKKRYLLDMGTQFTVAIKANQNQPTVEVAAGVANYSASCTDTTTDTTTQTICTIKVGTGFTPTQLIFGNTPAFGNQNPIGTKIQSISISPPTSS